RIIEIRDGCVVDDTGQNPGTSAKTMLAASLRMPSVATGRATREDFHEALRTAWRGMRINRSRTFLTLLGIISGVASVIVMLAIGEGARQKVMDQMGTLGTTIMYMGSRVPPQGGAAGLITAEDLAAIEALPDIRRVLPVIGDPVMVRYGNKARNLYVFASGEHMPDIHHWKVAQGRYYTAAEDRELAPLVVLGHEARRQFFPDEENPLGKQLLIGSASFEVIGVMQERGADSGAQDYDDMVFIPYQAGRAR